MHMQDDEHIELGDLQSSYLSAVLRKPKLTSAILACDACDYTLLCYRTSLDCGCRENPEGDLPALVRLQRLIPEDESIPGSCLYFTLGTVLNDDSAVRPLQTSGTPNERTPSSWGSGRQRSRRQLDASTSAAEKCRTKPYKRGVSAAEPDASAMV